MSSPNEYTKNAALEILLAQDRMMGKNSIVNNIPTSSGAKFSKEYETKQTSEILDPELSLKRLGYDAKDPIEWRKNPLFDKSDLYLELGRRILRKSNADCKVFIGDEEFSCHLIVLQCYSELFDGYSSVKKIAIPSDKCTADSFSFIYDWMVKEGQSYRALTRENVLDILNAANYLEVKELVEQCWGFIDNIHVFNEDTAFLLYSDAKARGLGEVQEMMIPRIKKFFLILVSSQDWLTLDVDDVTTLLSSNYIRVNCEIEVFMSAVRWLRYDWKNRDQFKYAVLRCVRFGNIEAWQLIDIKRNPENPEFMQLANDPSIAKLIDDGVSYMVIKYWYSHEDNELERWNTTLSLVEPLNRNWTGVRKTYSTYREFLSYLDHYRRSHLMEKVKTKVTDSLTDSFAENIEHDPEPSPVVVLRPQESLTSMEDFLKKNESYASSKNSYLIPHGR